jgi:ABC-type multidrug transport system permease subunit
MKRILNLVWLNIRLILSTRSELVSILVLPLIFTIVFGVVFGGVAWEPKVKVLFVNADNSVYSKRVEKLLRKQKGFSIRSDTRSKAEKTLSDRGADAAVIVDKGFGKAVETGKKTAIGIIRNPDSTRAFAVVEVTSGIAERIAANAKSAQVNGKLLDQARQSFLEKPLPSLGGEAAPHSSPSAPPNLKLLSKVPVKDLPDQMQIELGKTFPYLEKNPEFRELYESADKKWDPKPPVSVAATNIVPSKVRGDSTLAQGFSQSSLGFTLMFVMFIVFGGAQGILEERETGTLSRLLTTPITKAQLLTGKIAGLYMTGVLQAAILIVFGAFLFDVPWGQDPLPVILVVGSFILAATGLAIFLSAVTRTRGQMAAITNVLVISLAMLGGCFWQIEITPPFMQQLAQLTPTGWAMQGLIDIVVRNQGISQVYVPSMVLLGFAAAFFVAGLKFLKFE